ncbi:MAG: peptidoglycan editing factor PgeF [Pseudomonadota bacterium]
MNEPPCLTAPVLAKAANVAHGFFGRAGGVSRGIYTSLNTGPGSEDSKANVARNRSRCAQVIGVSQGHLLTVYQVHSPEVVTVDRPWTSGPPKADGMVTSTPGLAIGVLAADCMPWLLADPEAGVIAAAHAGWRGALGGVLENTVTAMESLGAARKRIRAALGPCLRQPNFEVGLDLAAEFTSRHPRSARFFAPGAQAEKRQFDLAAFGAWRLRESGVTRIDDLEICTLGAPDAYFSYRNSRRREEPDYGRNLSVIALR